MSWRATRRGDDDGQLSVAPGRGGGGEKGKKTELTGSANVGTFQEIYDRQRQLSPAWPPPPQQPLIPSTHQSGSPPGEANQESPRLCRRPPGAPPLSPDLMRCQAETAAAAVFPYGEDTCTVLLWAAVISGFHTAVMPWLTGLTLMGVWGFTQTAFNHDRLMKKQRKTPFVNYSNLSFAKQ